MRQREIAAALQQQEELKAVEQAAKVREYVKGLIPSGLNQISCFIFPEYLLNCIDYGEEEGQP